MITSQPGNSRPMAPDLIAHWVVKSARRDELVQWYGTVFGAEVTYQDDTVTFLTWDDESHRLAIIPVPKLVKFLFPFAKFRRKAYGIDHIALTFHSLERLLENYVRLERQGIRPVWSINHGPTISLYYEDPDGVRLEFQVENYAPGHESDFFYTAEFADNPIGVNIDPDYLLSQLRNGVPAEELRRREAGVRPGRRVVANKKTLNFRTL
ncbi:MULTISPECIES: VOC family protein [Rhodococcus]|uniref:VOC family protein n=1 Tax=Rhodococcus oxybenzonivorans TaxID=1990687 RepID=A0AAE4UV54_9NOCA|nr:MULTISPECIES: VOC family protein [Rhodococcus]MDV7244336.1 VOC family protein [Rhodococcus oxybenzonivorans]MDV7263505.1 VOC family protein [Rhodococcus oxybenzonivorans]MDV7274421.1 VOC family protein [Rhodococcus oxybenzonivorans]MDV7335734.1 VOC family protein [Rhodococcus oxybenzonivorans]MDV7345371.1 VOC family protein [Rhodococcus oxybenzonivorans]